MAGNINGYNATQNDAENGKTPAAMVQCTTPNPIFA